MSTAGLGRSIHLDPGLDLSLELVKGFSQGLLIGTPPGDDFSQLGQGRDAVIEYRGSATFAEIFHVRTGFRKRILRLLRGFLRFGFKIQRAAMRLTSCDGDFLSFESLLLFRAIRPEWIRSLALCPPVFYFEPRARLRQIGLGAANSLEEDGTRRVKPGFQAFHQACDQTAEEKLDRGIGEDSHRIPEGGRNLRAYPAPGFLEAIGEEIDRPHHADAELEAEQFPQPALVEGLAEEAHAFEHGGGNLLGFGEAALQHRAKGKVHLAVEKPEYFAHGLD